MAEKRTLEELIEIAREEERQKKNRVKALLQRRKEQERKARTRRLIERGAMLENRIEGAETLTNEQIGVFLDKTLKTEVARKTLAALREAGTGEAAAKAS